MALGLGTILGGVSSLASSAIGAIGSAVANRRVNDLLSMRRRENRQWYEQERSRDYTQRSEVQGLLNRQRELLDEQYRRARATNVVAGGTDEALALQQAAANQSLAGTVGDIAAQASLHADNLQQTYRNTESQLVQEEMAMRRQQANNIAAAASQGVNAGLQLIGVDINRLAASLDGAAQTIDTQSNRPIKQTR